ncbi:MAG TPA: tetratricopeptide repeat protein [bacterium]|nr:tetratricopeptide repeat protein [bacterium]
MIHQKSACYLLIAASIVLVYAHTLRAPFIHDDVGAIVENTHIRSLLPLSRSLTAPPQSTISGRPVAAGSLALNYTVSRLNPWSYHLVNILIHIAATILLFEILRLCLPTQYRSLSLIASLLWALHPLHTDAVTYTSTRTESLAGMFFLLAMLSMIRSAAGTHRRTWWTIGITSTVLAMGSKETAVVIPPVILLADRVFLSHSWKTVMQHRGSFHRIMIVTWIVPAYLIAGGPRSETVGFHFADLTALDYLRTQAGVIFHYLKLAVYPYPLVLDYADWPVAHAFTVPNVIGLLVLAISAGIAIVKSVSGSKTAFLGVWFFATLAPSSSIVPIVSEIAAERRMYLPLIAVILLTGTVLCRWEVLFPNNHLRRSVIGAAFLLCILAGAATYQRNMAYASDVSIWEDTVAKRPANARAHANLAAAYLNRGRTDDAASHLKKALQLDSGIGSGDGPLQNETLKSMENLGLLYLDTDRIDEGIRLLETCVEYRPDDAVTRLNLARGYLVSGTMDKAAGQVAQAVALAPDNPVARIRYAQILAAAGKLAEAKRHARKAAELAPHDPSIQKTARNIMNLDTPSTSP